LIERREPEHRLTKWREGEITMKTMKRWMKTMRITELLNIIKLWSFKAFSLKLQKKGLRLK
jgi:hypothetical protein